MIRSLRPFRATTSRMVALGSLQSRRLQDFNSGVRLALKFPSSTRDRIGHDCSRVIYRPCSLAIECETSEHDRAKLLAWLAIFIYPVGLWLATFALLHLARNEIVMRPEGRLSVAIAFLHSEYETGTYWWELAEIGRRFVLVGLFVVVQPGTIIQIFVGTMFCAAFLMVQLHARPYRRASDNYLALASSFCVLILFTVSILYKYDELTSSVDVEAKMSLEQKDDFLYSHSLSHLILFTSVTGSLFSAAAILFVQLGQEALRKSRLRRLMMLGDHREAQVAAKSMLNPRVLEEQIHGVGLYRRSAQGRAVESARPLPTKGPFHAFLSHSAQWI